MISDETPNNREADLKASTDKAVAALPADVKNGTFGVHVILKSLEPGKKADAKLRCTIEVDVLAMPDRAVFAPIVHSAEVVPTQAGGSGGGSGDDTADCIDAVLEHSMTEVAKAIADHKAGKPYEDVSAGSGSGSGSGSAAPAKKK